MKIYSLVTLGKEHTLPIPLNGKNKYIKFLKEARTDTEAFFSTPDKTLQEAIEGSQFFESGGEENIKLFFSTGEEETITQKGEKQTQKPPKGAKEFEPAEFPDVIEFKQAKDVLTGEPYNVGKTSKSLASPEGILAKAGELGISFPNLKVAE
jgi:fructose-specific component phosphotransferase system IIB-like protein